MEEELERIIKQISDLHLAYEDGTYTYRLDKLEIPNHFKKAFKAYRMVVLSKGLDDEELDWGGTVLPQFDIDILHEPYQSWSKTIQGTKTSVKERKVDDYPYLLIEGQIIGFDLTKVAKHFLAEAQDFLKKSTLSLLDKKLLKNQMRLLEKSIITFTKEQEIVSLEVKDFLIIEHDMRHPLNR